MGPIDFPLLWSYFGLMAVLSLFGLHRYALVYLYYRHRRRKLGPPAERFETLPGITVQLPIYNERFVARDLLDAVCALRYPRHLLQVQVLDDSTDETRTILECAVREKQALGEPVEYVRRPTREGFKAGALPDGP